MVDRLFSEPSLAALYDLFSPWERRSDFHFYLPFIMSARAVLDVGCGTGAMLHRARESGHTGRLCGLDPAPGMLEQARKRADIEWILGKFVRSPSLPFAHQRVASFECEAAVIGERRSDCGESCSQVAVFDQDLERMAGHHDQVELSIETH